MSTKSVAQNGNFTLTLTDSSAGLTAAVLTVTDISGTVYLQAVPMVIDSVSSAHHSLASLPYEGVFQAHVDFVDNGLSLSADWTLAYGVTTSQSTGGGTSPGGSGSSALTDLEFTAGAPIASLSDSAVNLVAGSQGYIHVPISASTPAGVSVDLTEQLNGASIYPVQIAVVQFSASSSDFQAGDWVTSGSTSFARLAITTANELTAAPYRVYVKVAGQYSLLAPALFPVIS